MNRFAPSNVRLACVALAFAALGGVGALGSAGVNAQEPPAAAPGDEGAAAEASTAAPAWFDKGRESLGEIILESSKNVFSATFYVVLLLFSMAAMAVALERLVRLRRGRVVPARLVRRLRELIERREDTLENLRALGDSSRTPLANVLRAGVVRAGRPLPEVEKSMEDAAAREMAAMRARHRPLGTIGSVAPLVGLLGTVVGMIIAFRVSSLEGVGKAELLAEGIYLALMTTAAGLTIAIPCLLLAAWFNTRVEKYMRDIDEALMDTMPSFARMENNVDHQGSGPRSRP